jgi:hypothetical protein
VITFCERSKRTTGWAPGAFFAADSVGPSRTYELATSNRLAPGGFEGEKTGAICPPETRVHCRTAIRVTPASSETLPLAGLTLLDRIAL